MFGRDPVLPADVIMGLVRDEPNPNEVDIEEYKHKMRKDLIKTYEQVNSKYFKIKHHYKEKYDLTQKMIEFKEGDLVLVYTPTTQKGLTKKFLATWTGPYEIIKRLGNVTYRVKKRRK